MTKEEFLQSTLDYYGADPIARRNIDMGDICKYQPMKETSEGCAIGRFMPIDKDYRDKCDNIGDIFHEDDLVKRLPEWMQKMETEFLMDVQRLHDSCIYEYWDANGLTKNGKKKVNRIIVEWKLNMPQINFVD